MAGASPGIFFTVSGWGLRDPAECLPFFFGVKIMAGAEQRRAKTLNAICIDWNHWKFPSFECKFTLHQE